MNRSARLIIASVFVTNVGNGAHLIAVAALLYQVTGSALSLGAVLSSEFVIALVMQLFSGSVVDRGRPKTVMLAADLSCGVVVLAAAAAYWVGLGIWPVIASVIYLNVAKPFYRSARFSLTPAIVSEDRLPKLNALSGSSLQAGQLAGVAAVGPIIAWSSPATAFALNGASFLAASALLLPITGESIERKVDELRLSVRGLYDDWKETVTLLVRNPQLLVHLFLASGDFIAIAMINLTLIPLNNDIEGNPVHLSLIDGSFAVGSLLTGLVAARITGALGDRASAVLALLLQAVAFLMLAVPGGLLAAMLAVSLLGVATTVSITVFMSSLQLRSKGPIKGRIGALRHLVLSMLAIVLIPSISLVLNSFGVRTGFVAIAAVMIVYLFVLLVGGAKFAYGSTLLDKPVSLKT